MASLLRASRLLKLGVRPSFRALPRGGSSSVSKALVAANQRSFTASPWVATDAFLSRHVGPTEEETNHMLKTVGVASLEDLMDQAVPQHIRLKEENHLPAPAGEQEALAELRGFAKENQVFRSFIGMGYHGTHTPSVVLRNVVENPGWYTSYTPYQPEISQGRLEMLLNYQTMIANLTGLEYSNASLLDEGTAAAEAFSMCFSALKGKAPKFFVASDAHPQTIDVIRTRAGPIGAEIVVGDPSTIPDLDLSGFCGALIQYPNTYGGVSDLSDITQALKSAKIPLVAATDPLALSLLKTPGDIGADIAVGSAQRFGVPMFYGGPHAGFMAVSNKYVRKMPGRVVGVSRDAEGRPGLRLAMQAREQHIRRDKATSNICTAQALLANCAASFGIYHGPDGVRRIAQKVHHQANITAAALRSLGHRVDEGFFDNLLISLEGTSADAIHGEAQARFMNFRPIDDSTIGLNLDETTTRADILNVIAAFGASDPEAILAAAETEAPASTIPEALRRTAPLLDHPIFNMHHSETQMMRYLNLLERKDLALNYGMISLGSCTMKLNAASEMLPVTWPEFANVHPFAPFSQVSGYQKMIDSLNTWLCSITGFAAVSTQPNSGANGEYAGLMCIRNYLHSKGEDQRDVCLIPVSAHGTNPASAAMCGMKVVVVASDEHGNVDLADLKAKAEKFSDRLAALMITYPSTYGVFEEGVVEIIDTIHAHGGQVYMDGANMNAQVGYTSPGFIGADVCHLNLHKTFCIPHGGGGPGVGSIGVASHLAPHLPGHAVIPTHGTGSNVAVRDAGAVAAAPFGSAGILPISWMYIRMLGNEGLKRATSTAILNANYMAKRLEEHFPIAFRSEEGFCAHEFIIDLRKLKQKSGISEEDVAKRLIDYGFHAPTMSWPVPGTLMVEPTESEHLAEVDRFCDAMIAIRGEIQEVIDGTADANNNVLKNAPHTMHRAVGDEWDFPYSRDKAAFPSAAMRANKFWASSARIDNVWGDRNLVCSCPPLEDYMHDEE